MVAGNVVEDRVQGDEWAPGGPSLYCARAALALGAEVTLLTNIPAGYPRAVLEGLTVAGRAVRNAPRYANTYDSSGNREQLLLDEGAPLDVSLAAGSGFDVLIVAPAYHELSALPAIEARVTAVSLQGALRSVDGDGVVRHRVDAGEAVRPFIRPAMLAFLSDEDEGEANGLASELSALGASVVLTRGHDGASLYHRDAHHTFEPVRAAPVDPTGAGDCFATAFAVRYAETESFAEAGWFAAAAGALAVEGYGLAGVPTRAAIEQRMKQVAA